MEDVVAAGRYADAVDAHVVRVRRAGGAVQHPLAEQVVGARVGHTTEQLTPVLALNCPGETSLISERHHLRSSVVGDGMYIKICPAVHMLLKQT